MYKIDSFIGEIQSTFNSFINIMTLQQLVISPTATGKTTAIINYADKHPFKKIALLCPTRALVDNIRDTNPNLICGYGIDFIIANRSVQFIVTTYDSIDNLQDIDLFFVDEGHQTSSHASFREVIPKLFQTQTKTVFITATPEVIEDYFPMSNRENYVLEIQLKKSRKLKVDIVNCDYKAEKMIEDIIFNRYRDFKEVYYPTTILIRINSKKVIDSVMNTFKPLLKDRIACIYSDDDNVLNSVQNEETVSQLQKGVFSKVDFVLCTSVFDTGLSFKVDRDIECYAISPFSETMPNPIDMVQLLARVRKNTGRYMQLTIVGNYQDYELERTPLKKYKSKVQLCDVMSNRYEVYSKLNEFDYTNVLGRYNISSNHKKSLDIKSFKIDSVSRKSKTWIAKNFNNFSEKYEIIKSNLKISENSEIQLKLITDDGLVKNKQEKSVNIERVFNILYDAVKFNIDFRLFIDDKFSNKRYETLKAVVDGYKKNQIFRNLIDGLNPYSENERFEYNELGYFNSINKTQRKIIKSLYNMIYNNCDFREKSVKMVIPETTDSNLVVFMKRFKSVLVDF